ncbi:unnamed protein product [Paramecium primaurelia]|uniref:Uncharacterized protein n=1 Tax=Paramecium primaurelia TaxID=5886 RepID=A0A8S1K6A9_PARPR|nr:unnamed protein product [Paramecium primaurelia]
MTDISFGGFISLKNIKNPQYEMEYLLDPVNDKYVRDILPIKIQNFEIKRLEWVDFVGKPNEEMPWIAHCYWNIIYDYQMIEEKEEPLIKQQQSPILPIKIQNDAQAKDIPQDIKKSPLIPLRKITEPSEQYGLRQQSPKLPPKLPLQQNDQLPRINNRLFNKPPTPSTRVSSVQRITRVSTPKNCSPQQKVARSNSSSSLKRQSPARQKVKLQVICKFSDKSWAKSTSDDELLEHETGHYLIGCLCALEFKRQIEQLGIMKSDNHSNEIKSIFQTNLRTFLKIEKDYDEETNHYFDTYLQKKWNHKIKEQLLLYEMYFNN